MIKLYMQLVFLCGFSQGSFNVLMMCCLSRDGLAGCFLNQCINRLHG